MKLFRVCLVTFIAIAGILDSSCAQTVLSKTNQTNPPQVQGWEAVTDFASKYPGQKLNIQDDDITFSAAGSYFVRYVGPYTTDQPGQIFEVEKIVPKTPSDVDLLCRTRLTFIVVTYIKDDPTLNSPSITFALFSGPTMPDPKTAGSSPNNCASFTYAAP
jgi:hypothetical protein